MAWVQKLKLGWTVAIPRRAADFERVPGRDGVARKGRQGVGRARKGQGGVCEIVNAVARYVGLQVRYLIASCRLR